MKRIRGTKPTYEERKILSFYGLDTYSWLVQKNTSTDIQIIHKTTGEIKTIKK